MSGDNEAIGSEKTPFAEIERRIIDLQQKLNEQVWMKIIRFSKLKCVNMDIQAAVK